MSAPNTNIEKQKRRHKPALIGIAAVAVFAAIVFFLNVDSAIDGDAMVEDDAVMMDGDARN